jgi:hypothetical protein
MVMHLPARADYYDGEGRMGRGLLDDTTLASISQQLPPIENLQRTVLQLSPDFVSIKFTLDSTIPTASVCLQDTVNILAEARYALHEALAHKIWYLEKSEPKNEAEAIFYSHFYTDDIALRLYSAGEHLANAVVAMLEISKRELSRHQKKKVSQQTIVGNYLRKEKPTHLITLAVLKLVNSSEWQDTNRYRDEWVHSQPPPVKGLGIVYRRGQRWKPDSGNSDQLGFGGGDDPEYSVDDLLKFIRPALFNFTATVNIVVQHYIELLKIQGIGIRS